MKRCPECGETKGLEEFHKNRVKADGLADQCKPCVLEAARRWQEANPERKMLTSARKRARKYGVPCTITEADIVIPDRCPVLGIRMERGGDSRENSPSLDRFVPELGYVPGNVSVISFRANSIKRNASPEELRRVADWAETTANKREV